MKYAYFTITAIIVSLFYITFHISFMEGAIFERKNNVCVGSFELSKIQESQSFFKDIYKMQDEEIKILREKVEKNVRDLSGCYNKNWKLQTENDTLLLNKE